MPKGKVFDMYQQGTGIGNTQMDSTRLHIRTHSLFRRRDVRVVTRYMGSGITASGSGSWTRDPGSQVMGSGSANFFVLEGIKDRSLFRYFILYDGETRIFRFARKKASFQDY